MSLRHLIDPLDFSRQEVEELLNCADDIAADRSRYAHVCDGKKLATLFYEPSTRTRLSFRGGHAEPGRFRYWAFRKPVPARRPKGKASQIPSG